ncbi:MAG: TolC family protein [Planctomycetota bacterium]
MRFASFVITAASFPIVALVSCRAIPPELREEREALAGTGETYSRPFEERELPMVKSDSAYVELLDRSLRADPRIEEAYFAWSAAIERVVIEGSPENPTIGIGWMLTEPIGGFFENIMFSVSQMITAPSKLQFAAKRALEEARAARVRYDALRFERKGRFREVFAEYDGSAREVELLEQEIKLLDELVQIIQQRISIGTSTAQDLIRLDLEKAQIRNEIEAAVNQRKLAMSKVNIMMSREPYEELQIPQPLAPLRMDASDAALVRLASKRNPQLREIEEILTSLSTEMGRARAENDPDVGAEIEREGTETKFKLLFTIPIRRDRVNAAIAFAEAKYKEAVAKRRTLQNDVSAETVASITAFREAERKYDYIDSELRPRARNSYDLLLKQFAWGGVTYLDVVDARRALLQIERALERARTDREKALGDLLACCGADAAEVADPKEN